MKIEKDALETGGEEGLENLGSKGDEGILEKEFQTKNLVIWTLKMESLAP